MLRNTMNSTVNGTWRNTSLQLNTSTSREYKFQCTSEMGSAHNEKNSCPLWLRYKQVSLYLDERRFTDCRKTFRRWPLTTVIEEAGLQIYNMVNRFKFSAR